MSEAPHRCIRFGPFEADLAAGELRKGDRRVRLQEQPFEVLAALLDRAGEVVTREELRARLWPRDSFGDFDQGLNTAINKLREALEDSAANPRFVETLPKRGYRFTHPIEAENDAPVQTQPRRNPMFLLTIAATLSIAAAALAVLWIQRPPPDLKLPLRRFTIRQPLPTGTVHSLRLAAISPNGRHIAIVAGEGESKLWIQDLDREQPRVVEGGDGAVAPFWSPDSSMIGFAAAGKLKKISVTGGSSIQLCDLPGGHTCGGSWSPDGGSIVFAAGSPCALHSVSASGGSSSLLVSPEMLGDR